MTRDALRQGLAGVALGACVAVNLVAVGAALARSEWGAAGAQSILVALIAAWAWLAPKIDATLDALLAASRAQQRTAERMAADIERQLNAGQPQFGVTVHGQVERKH